MTTGTYSNDFDSLITSGTQAISATIGTQVEINNADGWYGSKIGGNGATPMVLSGTNGNANSGALYSYGNTGETDRALGSLASGSNIPAFGAWFTNDSGTLFSSITITVTAEFWRSSTVNQNVLSFSYGFDTAGVSSTNFLTSSSMIAASELNLVGPAPVVSNGALNGNDPANQQLVSFTITDIDWFSGASLFIRWTDVNDTGNDAGLAIDNFSLTAVGGGPGSELFWSAGTWNSASSAGGSGSWQNGQGGWDPGKTANFGGAGAQVDLVGTVNADGGVNFTTDGYTLEGGQLQLGGSAGITVFPGVSAVINSVISGTSGLSKSGSGVLELGGSNTFSGAVTINSGYIQIGADENLGAGSNGIVLNGGGLKVQDNVEIGAGRSVTGAGALDVAADKTLRFAGGVNAAFTLVNTGTVTLGDVSTLTGVNFSEAGSLTTDIGAFLTGNVTTTHAAGTARMSGYYSLEGGVRTFTVANGTSDIDLEINATLAGTNYFHKLGLGAVRLTGDTSSEFTGGFRIGAVGTGNGGRLVLGSGVSLGTQTLQFNWGTLEAEADSVYSVGVSLGGREATRAVFAGANMTFQGNSSLFEGTGQQSRIDVNNTTTFNGTFVQNTGTTFVGTGFTVGGTGTMILNGDGSGQTRATTVTDSATLVINDIYGASVNVGADARLKGVGTILGLIQMSGIHAVGNSAGIQTAAGGVSYLGGASFEWELVGNSNANPGEDFDQLIITGGSISIDSNVTMGLIFNSVGSTVDWSDSFWDTDHTWTIVDNVGGGLLTGSFTLNPPSEWFDANGFLLSSFDPDAEFVLSSVNGDIILTYYAVPVPEPSTLVCVGLAGAGLFLLRRRQA